MKIVGRKFKEGFGMMWLKKRGFGWSEVLMRAN